jgi:hypothetical protein
MILMMYFFPFAVSAVVDLIFHLKGLHPDKGVNQLNSYA